MKKSKNTKKTIPSESELKCAYCNRVFVRESAIYSHSCESGRRWNERDRPGNRIAYAAYSHFYSMNINNKKKKTVQDFISSSYYLAFVKFGNYCVDVKIISVEHYVDWLLLNKISIDDWTSDLTYHRYLIYFLRHEDPFDAISRSVKTLMDLCEEHSGDSVDYLRWGNSNRICQNIINGRISAWLLYNCDSGIEFLNNVNEDQLRIIYEYINPELWALQFNRDVDTIVEIKKILKDGGF